MASTVQSVQKPSPALTVACRAEAARYALLRRLAPSIRHHLVVNLQPIGMVCEVMERRLREPEPDITNLQEIVRKIGSYTRASLNSNLDVVTWLAPEQGVRKTVAEGVRECLSLLATSLTFRGYVVRSEAAAPGEISCSAIRTLLTAAMIHLTDEVPPPADLLLSAQAVPAAFLLTLILRPTAGEQGFSAPEQYRRLQWADLEALAAAESVAVMRESKHHLVLAFPWADSLPH